MEKTKDFIEKAKAIHGDKYDYSKVVYNHSKEKVCIICPIHGEFWQIPNSHLRGCGCQECGKLITIAKKSHTQDEFIQKANDVHKGKYDYSKVNYVHNKKKVCILCPKHGEFWQMPSQHLRGIGCPKCDKSHKLTKDEFIQKANDVHKGKYDYSKVNYINSQTKICIICPIHGEFWQTPNSHLRGCGCQECNNERKKQIKYNTNNIIERFKKIHGNHFDYSKFKYGGINKKSLIICPIHGQFEMSAHSHLKGYGCPKCNQSALEKEIKDILLKNNIKYEEQKTFDWLIFKGKQYLDFYLPEYNIAIECQGIQHFKPLPFFTKGYETADIGFKEIVKRDDNKNKLCNKNGIKILYFSHKNIFIENKSNISIIFDDTDKILKEILKHE